MKLSRYAIVHPYHVFPGSIWPICVSISFYTLFIGLVSGIYSLSYARYIIILGVLQLAHTILSWYSSIVMEGTMEGKHSTEVQNGLKLGFYLFVISEIMLFATLFFVLGYTSVGSNFRLGSVWPPKGIIAFDVEAIPLLNLGILFLSGITVTKAWKNISALEYKEAINSLIHTLLLGTLFVLLQGFEYYSSFFTINSGVYGSIFFTLTGVHGIHVIFGGLYILGASIRLALGHYTSKHHLNLETASIYWHVVDIIWIIVILTVYL